MATADAQTFIYKGKDRSGKPTQGEIKSASVAVAKAQLRKQGIAPTNVKKKPKPLFSKSKPIKPMDIAVFTRQMATMMKAGVPLVQSFEIVAEGLENKNMEDLVLGIRDDISEGLGLSAAFKKHPKYFDDLYCSLVDAGEQAGTLEVMLDRIATYKEKTEKLKNKVKKALTYPAAVIVVGVIVVGILLVKVIPTFAETFGSFGADLPAFTLFVLGISESVQHSWFLWVITALLMFFGFREAKRRSEKFSYAVDKYSLKIPAIGDILYQSVAARFARTLSTTFAAGVPLVESLNSVAGAAGNAVYRDAILKIRDDVTTGVQLHLALRNTGKFPIMLIQMTTIGEESGSLDEMLAKAADHYEEAVDNAVDNLTALLEPMIMSVLGILCGGMMIAMYLPIFQLGNVVG